MSNPRNTEDCSKLAQSRLLSGVKACWTQVGSAFFSLPLAREERPLPRLVTRARAADLFERFFGRRGRIYS